MTDIVSQIAAFIRARLDEDDRDARGSLPGPWIVAEHDYQGRHWRTVGSLCDPKLVAEFPDYGADQRTAYHIARHDPARVLRRVGGMREILNSYDTAVRELDHALIRARAEPVDGHVPDDVQATLTRKQVKVVALGDVVLRLSLEYFDHDGYLDEWKQLTGPLSR